MAARLRAGLNGVIARRGVAGFVYGDSSVFHILLGQRCENPTDGDLRVPEGVSAATLKGAAGPLAGPLQIGMLLEGVDLFNSGGLLSIAHSDADIDLTISAFDRVLARLTDDSLL